MLKEHIGRGKRDKFYFEITLKYNICSFNVILYLHMYLQNMIIPVVIAKPIYTCLNKKMSLQRIQWKILMSVKLRKYILFHNRLYRVVIIIIFHLICVLIWNGLQISLITGHCQLPFYKKLSSQQMYLKWHDIYGC